MKESDLRYCILQLSIIYSLIDDKNIGYFINFAKKRPCFPIPGHEKWPIKPIYIEDVCYLVMAIIKNFQGNKIYSINGKETIYFKDMIKNLLDQIGGLKFRVFLPVSLFKFLMKSYQQLNRKIQFTPDQVDSLTAGEVFPNYGV